MRLVAGVDIGNSTTEVCIGEVNAAGRVRFLASARTATTGTKGTPFNIHGIRTALQEAMHSIGKDWGELDEVRLNEAAPVIGDTAMETLTETIITDSTMIGHNPGTPAGRGTGVGELIFLRNLGMARPGVDYILVVGREFAYEQIAELVNRLESHISILGLVLQADEAVLVYNRLTTKRPIVDEVSHIDRLEEGRLAAIEVAGPGESIRMLSNPYGIATLLGLNSRETREVTPIAKSLIGSRSAVVIHSPGGARRENILPAGNIRILGEREIGISLDEGAEAIMEALSRAGEIRDIEGEDKTNVGLMLGRIKTGMSRVSGADTSQISIKDILAVDTLAPVAVSGALAGETCLEKAVGIAAMVQTRQLPMQQIARELEGELGCRAYVAGVEAVMAVLGALTTPGTRLPLAILDMGGGSTDAALIGEDGQVVTTHQAGAGELVSMLIQTELGLADRQTAEQVKRYPLARVESLFHMRMENGRMEFVAESLDPRFFGRVVLLGPTGLIRLEQEIPMEKIVEVRREAKRKVFVTNALRALKAVAPDHNLKQISNVVLVGGSAEDFEIPEILMEELTGYRCVCGRGNIRGSEGPRNAVATGLVLSGVGVSHDK